MFFCVSNPSKNVYEIGFAPFLFIVQFIEAQKMLVMSHEDLHKLGDQLGDPNHAKVTLLGMTARCGSTLVGQMLARIPKVKNWTRQISGQLIPACVGNGPKARGSLEQPNFK